MSELTLSSIQKAISGQIEVPGDKSISHRAVMFGSLAEGTTVIENFLDGEDCLRTIDSFRSLGVSIEQNGTTVTVNSKGMTALQEPKVPLYFGNSGTTARLMIGILSGLPLWSIIYGDPYLTERPMDRVIHPLQKMGAVIDGRQNKSLLPIAIRGGDLKGIHYELPVKSAQVKSAILLAGLLADGETTVVEQTKTRDHTENLLKAFGADIQVSDLEIKITNKQRLKATDVYVPGDISSAAFLLVAAAIVPKSHLTIKNVGLNHTRTGIIDVLKDMGADLRITNEQTLNGESLGDITIAYTELEGTTISGNIIPRLIDELPIIALLATQANGTTIIKDAEELRVKETDRIAAVVDVLSTLGANIEETDDGMVIHGKTSLNGGHVSAYGDHRIAMMNVIASLIATDQVILDDESSIAISYPNFFNDLKQITE